MRVLVADDEEQIRTLMSRILARSGYEVDLAFDGRDAVEKLERSHYDAIVLDLMMPRLDGFGVLEYLMEHDPLMVEKTVVATAYPKVAFGERLHHVCHVITKPFEIDQLTKSVRDCVGVEARDPGPGPSSSAG